MTKLLLAALAASLAAPAAALAPGDRLLSLSGGVALPGGAVGDNAKLGFSGGASFGRQFSEAVSAGLDAEYLRFGDRDLAGGITSGADVLGLGASLRLSASRAKRAHAPFVSLGAALNRVARRSTAPGVDDHHVDWEPGVVVGAGTLVSSGDSLSFGPFARFRSLGRFGWGVTAGLELDFALAPSKR